MPQPVLRGHRRPSAGADRAHVLCAVFGYHCSPALRGVLRQAGGLLRLRLGSLFFFYHYAPPHQQSIASLDAAPAATMMRSTDPINSPKLWDSSFEITMRKRHVTED